MVEPDRMKRNRLFEYVAKPLEAFIAPGHLLRQIDQHIDFRRLAEPLHEVYVPDQGRPAIPPETLVRALVLGYVYRIPSFRKLCTAIQENLAFRWFLYLGLEDEVFDASTITVFLQRVGAKGFRALLCGLNHELARAGVLSEQVYTDSSLVSAAVSGRELAPTNMPAEEFARAASEENGLFVTREAVAERRLVGRGRKVRGRVVRLVRRYFQDPKGRLPLHPRDPDARWRTLNGKPARLAYKQHLMVDDRGFILAQAVTHATARDADSVPGLMKEAPVQARVLAADTSYSLGKLRRFLEKRGVQAYIPIHTRHAENRDKRKGFHLESPTELICPAGKTLKRTTFYKRDDAWLYTTRVSDCRACTQRNSCLPPRSNREFVQLSTYEAEFARAEERNSTARYRRLMRRRETVVEGVFAHLKDLGFRRVRRLGLARVQCEGYMVAFAHNILKTIRYLVGPCTGAITSPSGTGVSTHGFSGVRVVFQPSSS